MQLHAFFRMTESELYTSGFDWEGGSPSVFLRPMNPALSAQHYFREDSPICAIDSEAWGKKCGSSMLTPASPVFCSSSYMSQESSCCSALNNAVIMEEDDADTIPTDEEKYVAPPALEDVSPIIRDQVSILRPATIEDNTTNSTLEFLLNDPPPILSSSPPHWSPGVIQPSTPRSSNYGAIEATLNFLDGLPTNSPPDEKLQTPKKSSFEEESSLSIINPMMISDCKLALTVSPPKPSRNISPSLPETVVSPPKQAPQLLTPHVFAPHVFYPPGKVTLSSIEQELKNAEDGRRRLLAQIQQNRRNFVSERSADRSVYLDRDADKSTHTHIPPRSAGSRYTDRLSFTHPVRPTDRSSHSVSAGSRFADGLKHSAPLTDRSMHSGSRFADRLSSANISRLTDRSNGSLKSVRPTGRLATPREVFPQAKSAVLTTDSLPTTRIKPLSRTSDKSTHSVYAAQTRGFSARPSERSIVEARGQSAELSRLGDRSIFVRPSERSIVEARGQSVERSRLANRSIFVRPSERSIVEARGQSIERSRLGDRSIFVRSETPLVVRRITGLPQRATQRPPWRF